MLQRVKVIVFNGVSLSLSFDMNTGDARGGRYLYNFEILRRVRGGTICASFTKTHPFRHRARYCVLRHTGARARATILHQVNYLRGKFIARTL